MRLHAFSYICADHFAVSMVIKMPFSIDVAAATAEAKKYCSENGLDYSKVDSVQRIRTIEGTFALFCQSKKGVVVDGLINDIATQPYVVLVCDEEYHISTTEFTELIR